MIKAALFDMDGVLVDNNSYHIEAFRIWCKRHNIELDEKEFEKYMGRGNREVIPGVMKKELSDEQCRIYSDEKEAIYRSIISPVIKPVNGLLNFLEDVKSHGMLCAVGSSGIRQNVDMVLDKCHIRKYFDKIVDGNQLTKAKPDPEVYLKCAELLNVSPAECIVFEDAYAGIEAARRAGMKVVAVATSIKRDKHKDYDFLIDDFTQIKVSDLAHLMVTE